MYVDRIMTREVVVVAPNAKLAEIAQTMTERQVRHLPVVDASGTLLGMIARRDVQKATPSSITTLSVGEVNYLTSKVTAEQVMQADLIICTPQTLVEDAGLLIRQNKIGAIPVIDAGNLVGIVSTGDLLDFFLDITGCNTESTARIALHLPDATGELAKLLGEINSCGGYIATVVSPLHPDETGMRIAIVRYRHDNPQLVDQHLRDKGYDILSEHLPQQ